MKYPKVSLNIYTEAHKYRLTQAVINMFTKSILFVNYSDKSWYHAICCSVPNPSHTTVCRPQGSLDQSRSTWICVTSQGYTLYI